MVGMCLLFFQQLVCRLAVVLDGAGVGEDRVLSGVERQHAEQSVAAPVPENGPLPVPKHRLGAQCQQCCASLTNREKVTE